MSDLVLVGGGGESIGGHLIGDLLCADKRVRAVHVRPIEEWHQLHEDAESLVLDLRLIVPCRQAVAGCAEVYNLACDIGGMGFIQNKKALCMLSVLINTHILQASQEQDIQRFFYSSSACVCAADKQTDAANPSLNESDAYPAMPEDGYGRKKLFSERTCRHFREDLGLYTRMGRYHSVYGTRRNRADGRAQDWPGPEAASRHGLLQAQRGICEALRGSHVPYAPAGWARALADRDRQGSLDPRMPADGRRPGQPCNRRPAGHRGLAEASGRGRSRRRIPGQGRAPSRVGTADELRAADPAKGRRRPIGPHRRPVFAATPRTPRNLALSRPGTFQLPRSPAPTMNGAHREISPHPPLHVSHQPRSRECTLPLSPERPACASPAALLSRPNENSYTPFRDAEVAE